MNNSLRAQLRYDSREHPDYTASDEREPVTGNREVTVTFGGVRLLVDCVTQDDEIVDISYITHVDESGKELGVLTSFITEVGRREIMKLIRGSHHER